MLSKLIKYIKCNSYEIHIPELYNIFKNNLKLYYCKNISNMNNIIDRFPRTTKVIKQHTLCVCIEDNYIYAFILDLDESIKILLDILLDYIPDDKLKLDYLLSKKIILNNIYQIHPDLKSKYNIKKIANNIYSINYTIFVKHYFKDNKLHNYMEEDIIQIDTIIFELSPQNRIISIILDNNNHPNVDSDGNYCLKEFGYLEFNSNIVDIILKTISIAQLDTSVH